MSSPSPSFHSARQPVDVLLLTSSPEEYAAALQVNTGAEFGGVWEERTNSEGLPLASRTFQAGDGGPLRVVLASTSGPGRSGAMAARWVEAFAPRCLAICGVCSGRPGKVERGDVVLADVLWEYDLGGRELRFPGAPESDEALVWVGTSHRLDAEWKRQADRFTPASGFRVRVGPLVTSTAALSERHLQQLSEWNEPVLGLDLSAATLGSLSELPGLEQVLIMKGVRDLSAPTRNDLGEYAAHAAAECLLEFLRQNLSTTARTGPQAPEPLQALEAARDEVARLERLVKCDPAAFSPSLAHGLRTLATRQREAGEAGTAFESDHTVLGLYRELARQHPATFRPHLASVLNNLCIQQRRHGTSWMGAEQAKEAVALFRELASRAPALLAELAISLNNLGTLQRDMGDTREAVESAREAVALQRRLAEQSPDEHLPALAAFLNSLVAARNVLGQTEEALAAARESVDLRRSLIQRHPGTLAPELALSLVNLGALQQAIGEHEAALASSREAVDLLWPHFEAQPEVFGAPMGKCLVGHLQCLAAAGHVPAKPLRERVELLTMLLPEWDEVLSDLLPESDEEPSDARRASSPLFWSGSVVAVVLLLLLVTAGRC